VSGSSNTLSYLPQGVGGYIDLSQYGIKPGGYYARVNPKTKCWECIPVPDNCMVPVHSKTAAFLYRVPRDPKPIMCVADKEYCGCGGSTVVVNGTAGGDGSPDGNAAELTEGQLAQVELVVQQCLDQGAQEEIDEKTSEEEDG